MIDKTIYAQKNKNTLGRKWKRDKHEQSFYERRVARLKGAKKQERVEKDSLSMSERENESQTRVKGKASTTSHNTYLKARTGRAS